uniref:Uncharacterized protein n=1 Tax=Cucumis sativus TaxID=3659 RepID=A0A0A0M317_CUCSA
MGQIKNPCLQLLSLIVQLLTPIPIEFQDALWPYERYDLPSCMAISRIRTMVLGLKNLWVPTFGWAKGSPLISFPLAKIIFLFKSLPTPLIPKLGLKRLKHAGPTKDRLKRHRSDLIVLDYDRTQNLIGKEKSKWLTMQQTGIQSELKKGDSTSSNPLHQPTNEVMNSSILKMEEHRAMKPRRDKHQSAET